MFRLLLTVLMFLLVFGHSFAANLIKPDIFTNNWSNLPVAAINYQNQDEERDTKNEKEPPRIVSFEKQIPKTKSVSIKQVIKIFLTGYGKNVKFKTKVDRRLFKIFKRLIAFYGLKTKKKSKKNSKYSYDVHFYNFRTLYVLHTRQGYSRNTRVRISLFQESLVIDLKSAKKRLKKAKSSVDALNVKKENRYISYLDGMLKELGRLITHLDKQKQ